MKLTVEQVIKKGVVNRNRNALIGLLIIPLIIYCGVKGLDIKYGLVGLLIIILVIVIRQIISEQNWRIWALSNVDNPKEFKAIASELFLIPRNDKLYNNLEFHTSTYKTKWAKLQSRYSEVVENKPIVIPISGLTFARNTFNCLFMRPLLLLKPKSKSELYIDTETIIVNGINSYLWKDIINEEIYISYFDSRFQDSTINFLKFEYDTEMIEIPLCYYRINEHYLKRIIETIRKG